LIIYT